MIDYFERRYSPGNMKLVATGRVDFDALVKSADRHCGQWKHFEVSRQKGPADVPSAPPLFIPRDGAAQQYIVQVSPAPSAESSDRYAQNLMASIFGDESGSRLFWELVDTGLAEYAVAGTHEFQGAGITMTFLSCGPEDARDNYLAIGNLQEQIQSEGVTESELELAKSKICSQIVRRAERPSNRLFAVGNHWLQRGSYITTRESVEAFQNVTTEDVRRVLSEHPLTSHATATAGPLSSLD